MSRFCRLCLMFVFLVSRFGLIIHRPNATMLSIGHVMLATGLPEVGTYELVRPSGERQLVYVWNTYVPYDWMAPVSVDGLRLGLYPVVVGYTRGSRYLYSLRAVEEGDYFVIRPGSAIFAIRIVRLQ